MRIAIVTGSSRGLGRTVVDAVLARGWHVLGIARSVPDGLDDERYLHLRADPATAPAIEHALRQELANGCERLALVNNAGVVEPIAPVRDLDAHAIARAFAVNVTAPIWLMGLAVRAAGAAPLRIVNVSSGAATKAYAGWAAYCGSKAALRMAGEVLAKELDEVEALRGRDIAIVSYAPHVVATAMQAVLRETAAERFPEHARFVALHERGELVPPDAPAGEIAALLDADDLPRHSEQRYRPPA